MPAIVKPAAALALLALAVPSSAVAAPTTSLSNGTLSVTGETVDETLTIVQTGTMSRCSVRTG